MKIVHVIPFYAPAWGYGGPVRVCYDFVNSLSKKGHNITVLTTDAYDHTRRIRSGCEEEGRVKIIRFRNLSNRLAKQYNFFLPLGFARYLKSNIKNADVIHLHSFYTILNIIAATYAKKFDIPYILHLHESPVPEKILGKVAIKKVFNTLFGKKILRNSSQILTLTEKEHRIVAKTYPQFENKITVLPNPLSIAAKPRLDNDKIRSGLGLTKKNKILLSLSRLSSLKRIDIAILALGKLLKKDGAYRLIVAGPDEGDNLAKLKKISEQLSISDKIIFTGPVDSEKKEELFCIADLYLLLSDYESFSVTTLEAIARGVPAVLSKNVGVASELKPFGVAVITSTSSATAVSKSIIAAYKQRYELKKGAQKALMRFDLNTLSNKLEMVYKTAERCQ